MSILSKRVVALGNTADVSVESAVLEYETLCSYAVFVLVSVPIAFLLIMPFSEQSGLIFYVKVRNLLAFPHLKQS